MAKTVKNLPIDTTKVQAFLDENKVFKIANDNLWRTLENWWKEDPIRFHDDLWADFDTVKKTYHFVNEGISFSRSYSHQPPLDYITCYVRIFDAEDSYCTEYNLYLNYDLQPFDDSFC